MEDSTTLRERMIEQQMVARGIRDPRVLRAMREVPREAFVSSELVEFAYADTPLPIEEEQTISQPYIVALMTELLELDAGARVLEIGTGSGYAAAVLAKVAAEVYTVERHEVLAELARERFAQLGYANLHVRHGDGTLGWPEHAPYDGIVVAAGSPEVPQPLLDQLAVGGCLVIPTGPTDRLQKLLRVRRVAEDQYDKEDLGPVQFVPLIGVAGWPEGGGTRRGTAPARRAAPAARPPRTLPERIRDAAEPFHDLDTADLDPLLDRIGDARVVLLGEATHGTAEFYRMRARITMALVERRGFNIVAVEADWPDAARLDQYVRNMPVETAAEKPFTRFPSWMWANTQVLEFIRRLRTYNERFERPEDAVGFYGLDLYSLNTSISAVLQYLEGIDPDAARLARKRYGCLTPWEKDPATYGAAALRGRFRECEPEVTAMLQDLLNKRLEYTTLDGQRFLDAVQNARLIASAERYYRIMYYGSVESWNLRDQHMFDTLELLLQERGPASRAVVWAHNSHLGDASATEMGTQGEHNVGQLCRRRFGEDAYLIGFGTDHGTVAAASDWDEPMQVMRVRPAHAESYERLCHEAEVPAFLLPLRVDADEELRSALLKPRLERAIGVIYRPRTELQSHYFQATLPRQFDEYIWIDETHAVTPLGAEASHETPETFPFSV